MQTLQFFFDAGRQIFEFVEIPRTSWPVVSLDTIPIMFDNLQRIVVHSSVKIRHSELHNITGQTAQLIRECNPTSSILFFTILAMPYTSVLIIEIRLI